MQLRPYQLEALERSKQRYKAGVTRQVIQKATGLGKSLFFSALPNYFNFHGKMLVLVHREELAKQAADKILRLNPTFKVGLEMGSNRADADCNVVVAGVQTLGRANSERLAALDPKQFDVVVIDECHRSTANSYQTVLQHFWKHNPKILTVGVTATVNRADGVGLGDAGFQEIVYKMSILDGIKQGWLADLRGVKVDTTVQLDQLKTQAGDFQIGELSGAVNTPIRNALVVKAWKQHADNRKTIVFAVDIKHAQSLAEAFKTAGVEAAAIWGDDPDRKQKLYDHRAGKIKVLVNVEILIEGYDDPTVGCVVMARPTMSQVLFTQAIGRGSRIPTDVSNLIEARFNGQHISKEDCIILDVVDTTAKHSLCTLPSLFGLDRKTNLRGKKITEVMSRVEIVQKKKPFVDISKVLDIDKLESYAETVDLFRVSYPPEVVQLSEYQWHKSGNAYVLLLMGKDSLTVTPDILGQWHVVGTVNGAALHEIRKSFESAIQDGDGLVAMLGGKQAHLAAKRELKKDRTDPTQAQLLACRNLKLTVPQGATFGDVRRAISYKLSELKRNRRIA